MTRRPKRDGSRRLTTAVTEKGKSCQGRRNYGGTFLPTPPLAALPFENWSLPQQFPLKFFLLYGILLSAACRRCPE